MDVDRHQLERAAPADASTSSARASSSGTPNLLILRPVEMCGWLPESMSGLIRTATRATTPVPLGDRFDARELAGRLDVDGLQAERDGAFELVGRLADAGEDDGRGREPRLARQLDLPDGVGVRRAAQLPHQARDREHRVRLQRVVDGVGVTAECFVDRRVAISAASRRCRRRSACPRLRPRRQAARRRRRVPRSHLDRSRPVEAT